MHRVFCLMGKSASGKDSLYRDLIMGSGPELARVVPYTTRPIRTGERSGIDYHFTDEAGYQAMHAQGRILEERAYDTVHGLWRYFTADDGQIDLAKRSSLLIGTPEAAISLRRVFGAGLVPLYITVEDGERLQRALDRERAQAEPKYAEMCRRFLADEADFAPEKLRAAGVQRAFPNVKREECLAALRAYIEECLHEGPAQ